MFWTLSHNCTDYEGNKMVQDKLKTAADIMRERSKKAKERAGEYKNGQNLRSGGKTA